MAHHETVPTDIKIQSGPEGLDMERMHVLADARRTAAVAINQIYVRPRALTRPIYALDGKLYPMSGCYVSANDVYVARRIRDGSLERIVPPKAQKTSLILEE
jgi:hypothetical protein